MINYGIATVIPHLSGGWALPGGQRVESREKAAEAAEKMNNLMKPKHIRVTRGPAGDDIHAFQ